MSTPFRTTWIILATLFSTLLIGCASKDATQYSLPKVTLPKTLSKLEIPSQNNTNQKPITLNQTAIENWWKLSNDQELKELIDQALANNRDLRIATWQIAQAQAKAQKATAAKTPSLNLPLSATYQAPYTGVGRQDASTPIKAYNLYQIGPQLSWRPDIWGEIDATKLSAELQLWYSTFSRDDTQRNVIAELANNYIEYRSLNDRLRVAKETSALMQDMLHALMERVEKGDATNTELSQQQNALFSIQATIPDLRSQRQVSINKIAELIGILPGLLKLSDEGIDKITLPETMPVTPSELLVKRPDIRAIEARLLSANADIDVARARLYPSIDITAQRGYGSQNTVDIFKDYNLFWNLAANLSMTLFDGGAKDADIALSKAVHEEMTETYLKVVYNAVKEVETAIIGVSQSFNSLEKQQQAAEAARAAWRQSKEAYIAGALDFMALLDIQRSYYRSLDDLYRGYMNRYQAQVGFYKALGAGSSIDNSTTSIPNGQKMPTNEQVISTVEQSSGQWFVEFQGVFTNTSFQALYRVLQKRLNANEVKNAALLPLLQGQVSDKDGERVAWYRAYLGGFNTEQEANNLCQTVSIYQNCTPLTATNIMDKQAFRALQSDVKHRSNTQLDSNDTQLKTQPEPKPLDTSSEAAVEPATAPPIPSIIQLTPVSVETLSLPSEQRLTIPQPQPLPVSIAQEPSTVKSAYVNTTPVTAPAWEENPNAIFAVQLGSYRSEASFNEQLAYWSQIRWFDVIGKQTRDKHWFTIRLKQTFTTEQQAIAHARTLRLIPEKEFIIVRAEK
jgi:NodT family efflux transporter outer membrane factor (OMF) lipoprotein